MSKDSNENINKKIDNELKKEELKNKFGGNFGGSSDLPPEVESDWLNYIEQFEEQHKRNVQTTVYKFIGEPKYKKTSEIQDKDLIAELDRICEILHNNGIFLDTLCEVDDRELYRFITEELFEQEIDDMRIEGMMTNFIYEEFHPNAKYDIESAFDYFFRMTLGKSENIGGTGYDLLYIDTKNYQNSEGTQIDEEIVLKKINNFLDSFDHFEIISIEIIDISINKEETNALLTFKTNYEGCFENNEESFVFKGNGEFKLKPSEYGGWDIYNIKMPGLEI